jgi:hypothetical protein
VACRVAEGGISDAVFSDYCGLMPANSMILAYFAVSSAMNLANSGAAIGMGT